MDIITKIACFEMELIARILNCLKIEDLVKMDNVCSSWREVLDDLGAFKRRNRLLNTGKYRNESRLLMKINKFINWRQPVPRSNTGQETKKHCLNLLRIEKMLNQSNYLKSAAVIYSQHKSLRQNGNNILLECLVSNVYPYCLRFFYAESYIDRLFNR